MILLTPLQTPSPLGHSAIGVEKNEDSFSAAGYVPLDIVLCSKMPKICAVSISQLNIINSVLHVKIGEVNVDNLALSNLDGLLLVKVIGVVSREVWRSHHPTTWKAFRLLW